MVVLPQPLSSTEASPEAPNSEHLGKLVSFANNGCQSRAGSWEVSLLFGQEEGSRVARES